MHIIVCIKQTPSSTNVQINPKTGTLNREGMAAAINPFDEFAIEEAVRIKEKVPGSTVSVVTMGPPQAEEALRDAIARGCDDAFHVTDRAFAGADTWATSYTLQMAIRKIGEVKKPYDLILCGNKQTMEIPVMSGPELLLGWEFPMRPTSDTWKMLKRVVRSASGV